MVTLLTILSKVWPYIAGFAVLVGLYLYVDHKGYERAENKAKLEISQMETASAEAEALSWKQKYDKEKEYADKAIKADAAYAANVSKLDAALVQYAKTHRGPTSPAPQRVSTEGPDGPGENPVLPSVGGPQLPYDIVITYDDANVCKENTARLKEAHDWALTLNK